MSKTFEILKGEVVLDESWSDEEAMRELMDASNIIKGYKKDETKSIENLRANLQKEFLKEGDKHNPAAIKTLEDKIITHVAHFDQFTKEYDIVMDKCDEMIKAGINKVREEEPVRKQGLVEDTSVAISAEAPTKPKPEYVLDPVEERKRQIMAGLITPEMETIKAPKTNRDTVETTGVKKRNSGREGMAMARPGGAGTRGDRRSYPSTDTESVRRGSMKIFPDKPMNNI